MDRDQLALQALEAIQDILSAYPSFWLRPGSARQEQQITVALLQTMIGRVDEYTAGYFDIVIADECHRSIYGAWQAALTRFDTIHIGLTATPASYIERNTYDFYQCEPGTPDVSYSIKDAFRDGYLVPYRFATGITELLAEGTDVDDEHYDPVEFERRWTNVESNRLMIAEFDRLAWETYQELAPGQSPGPGKAIVFAITKHHAARLAQYLNERHPEHQGRYAEVITSDVADSDALIRQFKRETLPMVAVSVGMLDTRDPGGNLIDFIRAALGRLRIKSREERLEGTFRAWLVSRALTPRQAEYLCLLKNRGVATGHVRLEDLFEPPLSMLDVASKGVELFGKEGLKQVVAQLNEDVFDAAG